MSARRFSLHRAEAIARGGDMIADLIFDGIEILIDWWDRRRRRRRR